MARTDATVLLTKEKNNATDNTLEVIRPNGIYTLAHKGIAVGIRTRDIGVQGEFYLYPRSTFINRGHCINLAAKMNAKFECDDFSCMELLPKSST